MGYRRKGRGGSAIEQLPNIEQTRGGVHVASQGGWSLYVNDSKEQRYIHTMIRLGGYLSANGQFEGDRQAGWKLRIEWPKRSKMYTATLAWKENGNVGPEHMLLRGHIDNGWEGAIGDVEAAADIVKGMRWTQEAISQFGKGGENWSEVRPFVVMYPWEDSREPNAKYSPFTLCPGYSWDEASEGVLAMTFKLDNSNLRSRAAHDFKANAFLTGPDEDGKYQVWHRNNMHAWDPIDYEDFCARLIAGTNNEVNY